MKEIEVREIALRQIGYAVYCGSVEVRCRID